MGCCLSERFGFQSGRPDSNRRPPAPKAGALPGCATSRSTLIVPLVRVSARGRCPFAVRGGSGSRVSRPFRSATSSSWLGDRLLVRERRRSRRSSWSRVASRPPSRSFARPEPGLVLFLAVASISPQPQRSRRASSASSPLSACSALPSCITSTSRRSRTWTSGSLSSSSTSRRSSWRSGRASSSTSRFAGALDGPRPRPRRALPRHRGLEAVGAHGVGVAASLGAACACAFYILMAERACAAGATSSRSWLGASSSCPLLGHRSALVGLPGGHFAADA